MLERGFHRSFAEIFDLIKQQENRRLAAGPDSNLWNQCPLTEEPEKLDMMRDQLVEAESAMLLGNDHTLPNWLERVTLVYSDCHILPYLKIHVYEEFSSFTI